MTKEEMEELNGLAASMGLYDDKNPCKRAVILGKAIKALEQDPCDKCVYSTKDGCCQYDDITETILPFEPCEVEAAKLQQAYNKGFEDCRQAVLDCLTVTKLKKFDFVLHAREEIKKLPPVTPQPKTGRWIYEKRKRLIDETDEGAEYITDYWCKCSNCDGDFGYRKMKDAFCKYCGAKMIESQESEEV